MAAIPDTMNPIMCVRMNGSLKLKGIKWNGCLPFGKGRGSIGTRFGLKRRTQAATRRREKV